MKIDLLARLQANQRRRVAARKEDRVRSRYWHGWWAWRPVLDSETDGRIIWLEPVLRRRTRPAYHRRSVWAYRSVNVAKGSIAGTR